MTVNISGVGFQIRLIASNTYPQGITLTQFADDTDPFDVPSMQIADTAKGLNSDQLVWNVNNPIKITLAMQPDTVDDKNLSALFALNRATLGRVSTLDIITLIGIYPDGSTTALADGVITDGMPATSVATAGRKKSKTYGFSFNQVANL